VRNPIALGRGRDFLKITLNGLIEDYKSIKESFK
jgi:hypothetical protein